MLVVSLSYAPASGDPLRARICSSKPNLADNIEAAGKTWAGYAQGMPAPCTRVSAPNYAPDALPFRTFNDIFSNTARCQAHVLPLT